MSFRIACLLRLGLPTSDFCPPSCALCSLRHTDSFGIHPFSCQRNRPHLLFKHDLFIRTLRDLASSANVRTQTQQLNIFQQLDEGNNKRMDLLLHGMGQNGNRLYIDVTFGDPRGQSNATYACTQPGFTLQKLAYTKINKYKNLCDRLGVSFLPAAIEIFGNTAAPVLELINNLSARASEISFIPHSILHAYWLKRFSTVIQLGNARFLLDSASRMSSSILAPPADVPDTEALLQDLHNAPFNA